MDILRLSQVAPERLRQMMLRSRAEIFDPERMAYVRAIVEDVRQRGDAAVVEYTQRYDGVALSSDRLRVDRQDVRRAFDAVDDGLRTALASSIERGRRYNEWLRPPGLLLDEMEPGITAGETSATAAHTSGRVRASHSAPPPPMDAPVR